MDKEKVLEFSTADILDEAVGLFGGDRGSQELIDVSENVVYSYRDGTNRRVLRLTHRGGRTTGQIQAELDWIAWLSGMGANVQKPVPSVNGRLVETIASDETDFRITSFDFLPGRELEDEEITPEVIREWGRTIGMLHRLTKTYEPPSCHEKRFSWKDDDDILNMEGYIHGDQPLVVEKFRDLISKLGELPVDRDCFGLIHSDAHYGNFFWDHGTIRLFDFDDCFHTWFALDLATVWYWALYLPQGDGNRRQFMTEFADTFMEGYSRENLLDPAWLKRIPLFLKYQEMLLYIYFNRTNDMDSLTDRQKEIAAAYRSRIENDIQWFGKMEI